MIQPLIELRFQRVPFVSRIEERLRRHARALLPRTGDIERCEVAITRALGPDQGFEPYEVRIELRRTGGEVLVDRASATPADRHGSDEDLVVQAVDDALHRMRRKIARAERVTAHQAVLGWRPAPWSTRSAGSGEIWYG